MIRLLEGAHGHLDKTTTLDFIAPFLLRMYLVPVFFMAGLKKIDSFDNIVMWFDKGLNLPFPTLMAYLATATEVIGAFCLLVGFAVRWISIPLLFTMFVAILTVHFDNGWAAIAPDASQATTRLNGFLAWLENNYPGRYNYITELGTPVILQNGIEYGASYIVMLFALFFYGAGKYVSMDYWIKERNYLPALITGGILTGAYFALRHFFPGYM